MGPFDAVNSISHTKKYLLEDEATEREYVPFIVNRAFSNFNDTLLLANEINKYPHLDKKLQYDFLFNSVTKRKRYSKWNKKKTDDKVDLIAQYYKYSIEKAKSVLPLLTDEQLAIIKQKLTQGGVDKKHESN